METVCSNQIKAQLKNQRWAMMRTSLVFQSSKTLFFLGGMKTVFLELKMKVWWQLILISIWMDSMKWQKRNIYSQQVNSPRKNGFESCRNLWVWQSMSSWEITLNSSRTFLLILFPTSLKKNLSQEWIDKSSSFKRAKGLTQTNCRIKRFSGTK